VRLTDAVARLLADGHSCFVEVSPHPVLALALHATLEHAAPTGGQGPGTQATVVGTLRRDAGDLARVLLSLGELHARGQRVDWATVFAALGAMAGAGWRPRRVDLPTYAFQRERFWLEAPRPRGAAAVGAVEVAGEPVAHVEAVVERLLALAPEERELAMLALVQAQIADVLRLASPSLVEPHRPFTELGLDSIMALELRNRLGAAVRLRLPATLLFEYPTSHRLAFELLHQLRPDAQPAPARQPDAPPAILDPEGAVPESAVPEGADPEGAVPEEDGGAPLVSQIVQLLQLHEVDLAMQLLSVSARARRAGEARRRSRPRAPSPRPLQLARGPASSPPVLCLAPTPPVSIRVAYATLASSLAGRRDVWGLTRPGYGPEEALPSDLDELLAPHVEHVKEIAAGGPFVLLGFSSGGWIAHALAAQLERIGLPPTALVLVDTYLPGELTPGLLSVFMSWLTRFPLGQRDSEFTAFGWYFFELFARWTPTPIAAPTLFLRCAEPVPGIEREQVPGRGGWQSSWRDAHSLIDIPAHHYNAMMEHAGFAAQVIHDWLAALPAGSAREGLTPLLAQQPAW
jgi:acyl carrier protein